MARERFSIIKTLIALALVCATLLAAHWQFQRGLHRHRLNATIEANIAKPAIPLSIALVNPKSHEWQSVDDRGRFDKEVNILLRNHYFEGRYGFEVLTLFKPTQGQSYWVDRGWVAAGATAAEKPQLPALPDGVVDIRGRLRLNTSLPQGTIFATGSGSNSPLLREANAQKQIDNQLFYLDLLSGSTQELTPQVPAEVPELSDGPHMAYAAQWIFFGGLIVYGRFLMRRMDQLDGKTQSS